MDFEKACMMFTMEEPFYGILLTSMERIESKKVDTIGVTRSGGVFKLYYNPDFINRFQTDTVIALLKHEMLHIAFNHFTLWEDHALAKVNPNLRNIAEDLEVNCYLDRNVLRDAGGVWTEDFGWKKEEGARQYFKDLFAMAQAAPQKQKAKDPQKPCNDGQGSGQGNDASQSDIDDSEDDNENDEPQDDEDQEENQNSGDGAANGNGGGGGNSQSDDEDEDEDEENGGGLQLPQDLQDRVQSFDDHSIWPSDIDSSEQEMIERQIDEMLMFAAEETEKGCGSIPSELQQRIEKLRKKAKPAADWKRYFRHHMGNEFTEGIRKSKKRLSRRFPDAPGNRHQRKSRILVAIDTSGSICMPEYNEFFGQIKTLYPIATFHVLECDTHIAYEYEFTGKQNETVHGGGGTDFQPVIDYFNQHRKEYDSLVYFTDGYAPVPKGLMRNVLWVISSRGADIRPFKVNGACAVQITAKASY